MSDDITLIAFNAICQFVSDLASEYGKRHKPLLLYNRLISQTRVSHHDIIKKHILVFHGFCVANRDALHAKDASKLTQKKLEYSNRVFIDMGHIFHVASSDGSDSPDVIWRHLLTISAIIDPAGKAKEILKQAGSSLDGKTGAENDFLSNIISRVEKNVKPDANATETISNILQSGIITDLFSGMQNGQLDIGKLFGAVQGMMGSLKEQAGDDPEAKNALGALGNVVNGLGKGGAPDLAGMMSMMSSLMGGMAGASATPLASASKIEDVSAKTEKKEK